MTQGTRGKLPCGKCGKLHLGESCVGKDVCYLCGQAGHFSFDVLKGGEVRGSANNSNLQPLQRAISRVVLLLIEEVR